MFIAAAHDNSVLYLKMHITNTPEVNSQKQRRSTKEPGKSNNLRSGAVRCGADAVRCVLGAVRCGAGDE